MDNYSIQFENGVFYILENAQVLVTPKGNKVGTEYKGIAERIIEDLRTYGPDFSEHKSVLNWTQYMIDHLSSLSREEAEKEILARYPGEDWTCWWQGVSDEWDGFNGHWESRKRMIGEWLPKVTDMQLAAINSFGYLYDSINLPLSIAIIMEQNTGSKRDQTIETFLEDLATYTKYSDKFQNQALVKSFMLYYGIHLDENGPVLEDIIENERKLEEESFTLKKLIGRTVTIEQLIGRNYYHYTKGQQDRKQPGTLQLGEKLDYYGGCLEKDEVTPEKQIPKKYREWLPRKCWVKRFVSVDNPYLCYILCIEVSEKGRIEDAVFIVEYSKPSGWNEHYMALLTKRDRSDFYYEISGGLPEKVIDELKSLIAGRYIPAGFKLIGKKLPSYFIDRGRTYALQSPYRLAYMNIVVKTDENFIIQDIEYSTFLADGRGWSALFSIDREQIEDRQDERADMLIYIYDKYSDEEIKAMNR